MKAKTNLCTKSLTQFDLSNAIRKSKLFSRVKLKPTSRLVLESLVYHYPKIRVYVQTLSEETGASSRAVENALQELKEKGLIIITQTGRSSIYKLTAKFFELVNYAEQTSQKVHNRHAKNAVLQNKQNLIKKETKHASKADDDNLKISKETYYQLKSLNVYNIRNIANKYDESVIKQAIEETNKRNTNNPAGYLTTLLKSYNESQVNKKDAEKERIKRLLTEPFNHFNNKLLAESQLNSYNAFMIKSLKDTEIKHISEIAVFHADILNQSAFFLEFKQEMKKNNILKLKFKNFADELKGIIKTLE